MKLQEMSPWRASRVGILGGGQLSRMLLEPGLRLGFRPLVLAERAGDPAAQLCPDAVLGGLNDPVTLRRFFAQVDRVIFENEFVSVPLLQKVSEEIQSREGRLVEFFPSLSVIRTLQDKLGQKQVLEQLSIPCAPYLVWESESEPLSRWIARVRSGFPNGCVYKWSQFGYDGKGNWLESSKKPRTPDSEQGLIEFCENGVRKGARIFAESWVDYRRELAVVGCRSTRGETIVYPLVLSEQESGICRWVSGPATHLGVEASLETAAKGYAEKIADHLQITGCFALELFETAEGKLWVNELAPRVHNSGHYSQDACVTSQFENHWRAVFGMKLGSVDSAEGFLMLNLLGPEGIEGTGTPDFARSLVLPEDCHLHWYGKEEVRPGRKMGHANAVLGSKTVSGGVSKWVEESRQVLSDLEKRLWSLN